MRRRGRVIAVGVGAVLVLIAAVFVLGNLFTYGRIFPPARYECRVRNETSIPVVVALRQSLENTWHTPFVDQRLIPPGSEEVFSYQSRDQFIAGLVSENNQRGPEFGGYVETDFNVQSLEIPTKNVSYAIQLTGDGAPLFEEADHAQR